jgi:hypothetical protein
MDANESLFVVCRNGTFILPEGVIRSLSALMTNGIVDLREAVLVMAISATARVPSGSRPAVR